MSPDLSLLPDVGFEIDSAFSTLSPEEGFGLPTLSPEDGFGQETIMSSLSPESGFDVDSSLSTLSPEEGFVLPSLSPEDGFVQPGAIPDLAEVAGAAPESAIDRKAVAKQIRDEKEAYIIAIFKKTNMSQGLIRTSLERLASALESGNLYDKWRGVDLIDTIQRTIQERIGKKLGQPEDVADFDRLLDAMGLNKALVEQLKNETMLTTIDKEVYGKFIDKIGGADKTKEKYREILDKDTRSPIEWYLLSLLATQAVGSASTPEEAQRVTNELHVPEPIQDAYPAVVENNKHIGELWEKLKNANPALYDKLLSLVAKNKDEELTPDDKEIIKGVIAGRVGETVLNENFTILIRAECLRYYIAEKYLTGISLEDADVKQINYLVTKHLQGVKLTDVEKQTLLHFETDYQSRKQNLVFDFLHEAPKEKVNFEAMTAEEKFAYIVKSTNEVTRSLQINPTEEKAATLASLVVLAERLASTLTIDANGNTVPGEYEVMINSIALPDFIRNLDTIMREQTPDKIARAQTLFSHYQEEIRLYNKQIDDNLQTASLNDVLNKELGLMEDELMMGQVQPAAAEATVEIPQAQIEIQSSTLASEDHPDVNEDALFQIPGKRTYGVFDGMGGHAAGDVAAHLARDVAGRGAQALPENLTLEQAQEAVRKILLDANREVYAKSQEKQEYNGMGATASLVHIWEGPNGERKAVIGNVGDSRVYLLRNGKLEQITLDDNAVRKSWPNEQEARAVQARMNNATDLAALADNRERAIFNIRNAIEQSLGQTAISPRVHVVDLLPGDKLFICSDGISDNLTDNEINTILTQYPNNEEAVKKLTEASQIRSREQTHLRHKPDDMTGIIIAIPAETVAKAAGIKEMKPEDILKAIDELALKMVDEASYEANKNRYFELLTEYQGKTPEGTEYEVENPIFAESSPEAMERFEADEEKFLQEKAAQAVKEIEQEADQQKRVEKTRKLGKKGIAGLALLGVVGLTALSLILGPMRESKPVVPATAPPAGAPAQSVQGRRDAESSVPVVPKPPPAAASVPTPLEIRQEQTVYIGGDLTQKDHFPTAGHALKAQVKAWFGIDVPPGFTWSDAFNDTWNTTVEAQGLTESTDIHRPERPLETVRNNFPLQFTDEVKAAAQQNLKAAGLLP